MIRTDTYVLHPGECFLCKSSQGETVDTLRDDDWLGRIYICRSCVGTMADLFGFLDPTVAERRAEEYRHMAAQLADAERVAEHSVAASEALSVLFGALEDVKPAPRPRKQAAKKVPA